MIKTASGGVFHLRVGEVKIDLVEAVSLVVVAITVLAIVGAVYITVG